MRLQLWRMHSKIPWAIHMVRYPVEALPPTAYTTILQNFGCSSYKVRLILRDSILLLHRGLCLRDLINQQLQARRIAVSEDVRRSRGSQQHSAIRAPPHTHFQHGIKTLLKVLLTPAGVLSSERHTISLAQMVRVPRPVEMTLTIDSVITVRAHIALPLFLFLLLLLLLLLGHKRQAMFWSRINGLLSIHRYKVGRSSDHVN